ncbi:10947_t:CDS:1, partial [Funneliformis caledonium]
MYLPNECVECILKHIDENDIKTLYSTTLINRNWCRIGMVRLWKTPLSSKSSITSSNLTDISSNPSNTHNTYKIIPVLLSFLDKERKKELRILSKQFYIPKDTLNFHPRLQRDLKIPLHPLKIPDTSNLFEYPKYIERINFVELVGLVNKWVNSLLNDVLSTPSMFLNFYLYKCLNGWEYLRYITNHTNFRCPFIQFDKNPQVFFNFLLESLFQVLIKYSQIDSLSIINISNTQPLCLQLEKYLQNDDINKRFLSNLNSFDFCQSINSRIFTKISDLVRDTITTISIFIIPEELGVDEGENLDLVIRFINSLHSLQSVSFIGYNNINVTPIILSLQKHSSTLTTLKLILCTIDDEAIICLSKWDHLRELAFYQLHFIFNNDLSSTITSDDKIFPQLKTLDYVEYSSTNSLIAWIIQNNGYNLTHLDIHTNIERCIKLFDIISKNCPSLISLTTPISEQRDFIALFPILEHCNHLKRLFIYEFNIISINEDVLSSFIKILPDSLLYLKINKFEFSQINLGCKLKD